jgi:hypothetical protein
MRIAAFRYEHLSACLQRILSMLSGSDAYSINKVSKKCSICRTLNRCKWKWVTGKMYEMCNCMKRCYIVLGLKLMVDEILISVKRYFFCYIMEEYEYLKIVLAYDFNLFFLAPFSGTNEILSAIYVAYMCVSIFIKLVIDCYWHQSLPGSQLKTRVRITFK